MHPPVGSRRRTMRAAAAVLIVVGVAGLSVSPALAQTLTVSPSQVAPGGQTSFTGDGCPFNQPGQGPFFRSPAVRTDPPIDGLEYTLSANAITGVFTGTLSIPSGAVPGSYVLLVGCDPSTGPPFDYPPAPFTITGGTSSTTAPPTTAPSQTTTTTTSTVPTTIPTTTSPSTTMPADTTTTVLPTSTMISTVPPTSTTTTTTTTSTTTTSTTTTLPAATLPAATTAATDTAVPATAASAGQPTLILNPTDVAPGGQIAFRGDGCPFNQPGQGPFFQSPAVRTSPPINGFRFSLDAGAQTGIFTGTITIPADARPGTYQLLVGCDPSTGPRFDYPAPSFRVLGPGGSPTTTGSTQTPAVGTGPATLARTGGDPRKLLPFAALALVLGNGLMLASFAVDQRALRTISPPGIAPPG